MAAAGGDSTGRYAPPQPADGYQSDSLPWGGSLRPDLSVVPRVAAKTVSDANATSAAAQALALKPDGVRVSRKVVAAGSKQFRSRSGAVAYINPPVRKKAPALRLRKSRRRTFVLISVESVESPI